MEANRDFEFRAETPKDYRDIARVITAAFGRPNESDLVNALRGTPEFDPRFSLVALKTYAPDSTRTARVVAHLLFHSIYIAGDKTSRIPTLALAPVAVEPDFQNLEIGARLIRAGLDVVRRAGRESVIVLGHAAYYPRFGFEKASRWGIRAPFEVSDESFMALELCEGSLNAAAGVVVYPELYSRF